MYAVETIGYVDHEDRIAMQINRRLGLLFAVALDGADRQ